jgi:hypothetical protein
MHRWSHSAGLGRRCQADDVTPAVQTAVQTAQLAVHLANRELQRVRDAARRGVRDGTSPAALPALMTPLVAATLEFAAAQRVAAAAFTQLQGTQERKDEEALRAAVAALTEELVAARFGASRPVRRASPRSNLIPYTGRIRQQHRAERRMGG